MDLNKLTLAWGNEALKWSFFQEGNYGSLLTTEGEIHICAGTTEEIESFFSKGCLEEEAGRFNKGQGTDLIKLLRMVIREAKKQGLKEIKATPASKDLENCYRRICSKKGATEIKDEWGMSVFKIPL